MNFLIKCFLHIFQLLVKYLIKFGRSWGFPF